MTKYCNSCGQTKSTSEFSKRTAAKDGLQAYCKVCLNRRIIELAEHRLKTQDYIERKSKKCNLCNNIKPISQFFKKRGYSADGYGSYCKPCWNIYVKIKQRKYKK